MLLLLAPLLCSSLLFRTRRSTLLKSKSMVCRALRAARILACTIAEGDIGIALEPTTDGNVVAVVMPLHMLLLLLVLLTIGEAMLGAGIALLEEMLLLLLLELLFVLLPSTAAAAAPVPLVLPGVLPPPPPPGELLSLEF